jgi:hypothetical protein
MMLGISNILATNNYYTYIATLLNAAKSQIDNMIDIIV